MLTKLATFRGVSSEGEPLVRLFDPGISMVKQAGEMMPVIKEWLSAYKPEPNKIAILVNALGASEYWAQNVNGDLFPEAALVHDCDNHPGTQHPYDDFTGKIIPPYGAWTFMMAHAFCHHQNKDPNRAFGKVVLWAWNPRMHRVELVILIDRDLALQHGAQHVVDRILAGEYPDTSMGAKVPYDRCTICNHKSKTRNDYCGCVKLIGMGKILDDGRQIGVINDYPRFFDISFVFIGADKTAKMMCKLGSEMLPQSILDADALYGIPNDNVNDGLMKAASIQVPKNFYFEKDATPNTSIGAGTTGVDLGAETLHSGPANPLLASRIDQQENPERRAIADGALKTNADTNETDEFPEPLMPGRGKTASPLKQLFHRSREKTAMSPAIAGRLTRAGLGATIGGGTGAYLSDENRLKGGLFGAGAGALAGLGLGELTGRLGRAGARNLFNPKKFDEATKKIKTQVGDARSRIAELESKPLTELKEVSEYSHLKMNELPRLLQQESELAQKVEHIAGGLERIKPATEALGGNIGAMAGGLGAGALASEALGKTASEETGQYGSMKRVWEDAKKMKIGPPPKPNRKEYPFTGTIDFKGLVIHVENKPGTYREGKGWRTLMRIPYGEFLGTRGIDKDKLDVYVGPYRNAPNAYIIHQNFVRGPKKGKYDEDKVMVGFENLEQAKEAYLAHYDSDKYFRSATVMAFPLFKKAIMKKEVHGEKVASSYVQEMEKRAEDLKLEDLFSGAKSAGRRSKVWRHSDGRELKRTGSGMDDWDQVKQASVEKYAALNPQDLLKVSAEKWADIVKHIGPDKAVGKVSPLLSETEPSLPREALDDMSSKGMESALSTPSLMGMVLKPEEFQRILLNCMGKGDLANKLDDAGAIFSPTEGESAPCGPLSADQLDPELMKSLLPSMGDKSYLGPVVRRRIIKITIMKPEPLTEPTNVNSPLLSKVASAYNWYRREQMKLAADTMEVVPNTPELHSGLYGIEDEDLFGKTAMARGVDASTIAVVLGSVPLTLMYSAHLRGKRRKGEEVGTLKNLVADHPWLATMGTAAALRELMKAPKAKQIISELMGAGKRILKNAPAPVAG